MRVIRGDMKIVDLETIEIQEKLYGQSRTLIPRERRRLSRRGRRYPRRMPRQIVWEARIGSDDPERIPTLIERAMQDAPFRELIDGS